MAVNNGNKPLIIKRMLLKAQGSNPIKIKSALPNININSKLVKLATIPLYREDVIFESKDEAYLPGEYRSITILNKLNNLTNNCKTIARCITRKEELIEKTSDKLAQLIGQEAYNTLFYALCSVINQEYRIKAILSLLTVNKESHEAKTPRVKSKCMETNDKSCQTDESRLQIKKAVRRRIRKVLVPYVVKPEEANIKKVTVDPFAGILTPVCVKEVEFEGSVKSPANFLPLELLKTEKVETESADTTSTSPESAKSDLPDLGYLHDDNSNDSAKTFSSFQTYKTTSELMLNPTSLVNNVDRYTKEDHLILPNHSIVLMDKSVIRVPFKPEDDFHIATKENLQFLDEANRKKLLFHQMQIDYKYCLSLKDEDGNLPIHLAVINDDFELLKRQCVVLKIRNQDVDIPAGNGLTALKLSLYRESAYATNILLSHGADPFLADEDHCTCVHLAAEQKTDHLSIILHYCKLNARNIINQHAEELQTPEWEKKSDEELGNVVLQHLCTLFAYKPGYTPLMLASKLGLYENVRLLIESVPSSVHVTMPTSGNTALFLAVEAACTAASDCGNKSKVVDRFRKTIEILLEAGADPSIDNNYNFNVNLLLQEFNCAELSMLVANKLTFTKFFESEEDYSKNFDKYVLLKEGNTVSLKEINSKKAKSDKKEKYNAKNEVVNDKVEVDSKIVKLEPGNEYITKDSSKLVTNADNNVVTTETDNVTIDVDNKAITKAAGYHFVTIEASNKVFTTEPANKLATPEAGNKPVTKAARKKGVKIETGNKIVCNKPVTIETDNKIVRNKPVTTETGNKIVGNKPVKIETGNKTVTIETDNKSKSCNNKPVITENILIKNLPSTTRGIEKSNAKITVESNVNVKEFVIKPCSLKMDTVSTIKKIFWCPPKRKAESLNTDSKRQKKNA